ncbi:MAG TPA: SPOR domain-containing protein [Pseudolabrys sp.]|nr:SPOR domain-containing protein [Pseudolabrys sp.]
MANEIKPPRPERRTILKPLRRNPLWRLLGWGGIASLALVAVVLTGQTEAGSRRLRSAFDDSAAPAGAVAAVPLTAEGSAEARRLAAQVRELTADRDRLTSRIATLEQNIEDMTGSIKRQDDQLSAVRAAPGPSPNMTLAPPGRARLPTLIAPGADHAELPWFMSMRMPQVAEPPVPPQRTEAETPPLPPVRVATARELPPGPAPGKGDFAIDLGGAASVETLRALWTNLKTTYGPQLAGLQPLIAQHPKQPNGVTYRLVAGPLANAEEAARLCSRLPATRTGCHPAKFSGAQLAAH